MRLGLYFGYQHRDPIELVRAARLAEALGYDSVWTSEAYGHDAVTPLVWMAAHTKTIKVGTAILQMPARTPAVTAMTAATLDFLSGGRLILGLGVSGPQVVEGWHGVPYGKPLGRTREYVEILRRIIAREAPLEYQGEHYRIPISDGTGLGKPLRLIAPPLRANLPIFLASLGPRNVALTAEIADGWLPLFYSPQRRRVFEPYLLEGLGKVPGKTMKELHIAPMAQVALGDDVKACRRKVKAYLSFYIGGMGAREKNFYNDLVRRYGYEEAAIQIQDLFLSGRKQEALEAVPDELVDEVAFCGPRERIAELLALWRDSGVGTLICSAHDPESVKVMAELV